MDEFTLAIGPRILPDGINLDADFNGGHPVIYRRRITDSVSDGSLGPPGYEPGQKNLDGTDL